MELVKIYDDNHKYIGICEKDTTHKIGVWHDMFACIIINSKNNTVILQQKNYSHNNTHEDDFIEISVSGHIKYDEDIKDGVREIKEESGLCVLYDDLIQLGIRKNNRIINDIYTVREFQYLHLYDIDKNIKDYKDFDCEEVTDLISFDIDELINLITNKIDYIKGISTTKEVLVNISNFSKELISSDKFLLKLLIIIKKYINNEDITYLMW